MSVDKLLIQIERLIVISTRSQPDIGGPAILAASAATVRATTAMARRGLRMG